MAHPTTLTHLLIVCIELTVQSCVLAPLPAQARLPSVGMAGDYTGTCKAMLEGDSLPPKECRVDLSLSPSGVFRVTITSCDGYSAPSYARGFMLRYVSFPAFIHIWRFSSHVGACPGILSCP
jgi:hypothetical protein